MTEGYGKHSVFGSRPDRALDDEAEELLRDIESLSPFVLRTSDAPEDLDPSDVGEAGEGELSGQDGLGIEEDEPESLDEPARQMAADMESELEKTRAREQAEAAMDRRRRRLRGVLAGVLVVLALIAAVIGVFVWKNSIAPDVDPADTEALVTNSAGSDSTAFQPVQAGTAPNFASLFGCKRSEVRKRTQGALAFEGKLEKTAERSVKTQCYLQSATVVNAVGEACATALLGFDKNKRLVYVYCLYDLDALGVADAGFKTLAGDATVAASLLESMGVDVRSLPQGALTVAGDASARASSDKDDADSVEFSGGTGSGTAPASWTLTESYDRSLGKTLGDNSVMRTIGIELW